MMNVKRFLVLLLLPVFACVAAGMPPSFVNVVESEQRLIEPMMAFSGNVVSANDSQVAGEVSGRVISLAPIGQHVSKGQTIAQVDSSRLSIQLIEYQAGVAHAKSRLQFLEGEVARKQSLSKRNLSAANDLEGTKSDRDIAVAQLQIAEAKLNNIKRDIAQAEIKAPFEGIVMKRLANVGEFINAGQGLIRLVESSNRQVSSYIPIQLMQFVAIGDQLSIQSDFGIINGTVIGVAAGAEKQSQLVEVRLAIADSSWPFGLNVKVNVPTAEAVSRLVVPRDALVYRRQQSSVFVVKDDSTVRQVAVTLAESDTTWIAVFGELEVGERVVIRGAERLRDGQTVAIKSNNQQLISGAK
jgi:RND family efflux transporter MFP subunit